MWTENCGQKNYAITLFWTRLCLTHSATWLCGQARGPGPTEDGGGETKAVQRTWIGEHRSCEGYSGGGAATGTGAYPYG